MEETDAVALSGKAGRIVGGVAGFISGAKVGTAVIPIPVLGTTVGGVVGAVVVSEFGRWLGRATIGATSKLASTVRVLTPS